ncbi:MAG: GldG family protein [Gammaproteobacteria bacterium]
MKPLKESPRLMIRLQHWLFIVLSLAVAGLVAWQSWEHSVDWDLTGGSRHSLSEASRALLKRMPGPIHVEAFARSDDVLRTRVRDLVGRYQRLHPSLTLEFVNPDLEPDRVRDLGVTVEGELVVYYDGRLENLDKLDEQSMTNLLARLARGRERLVGYLTGHGERDLRGQANHDLGEFGQQLQLKGFSPEPVNLAAGDPLDDIPLLIVADPRVTLLPLEREILLGYLESGGNLIWLSEANARVELTELKQMLGVEMLPGVVVDSNTQLFGIKDPTFALVTHYPDEIEISKGLEAVSVFPRGAALELKQSEWIAVPLLQTRDSAWTEIGPLRGSVGFDPGDGEQRGPLTLGAALIRPKPTASAEAAKQAGQQRVLVIGDADFLSNAYLGNGANLDLGLRMLNWLSEDDDLIAIPSKTAPDVQLNLSEFAQAGIGFGFLVVLPLGLLMAGFLIRRGRQRGY